MRDVKAIDADLNCERAILAFERRSGETSRPVLDTKARIDELLDERSNVVRAMPGTAPSAVDA